MKQRLVAIGSGLGLIIDPAIVKRYQLDCNTVVEVAPKEDGMDILSIKESGERSSDDDVANAARDINQRYNNMMKNLAQCVRTSNL